MTENENAFFSQKLHFWLNFGCARILAISDSQISGYGRFDRILTRFILPFLHWMESFQGIAIRDSWLWRLGSAPASVSRPFEDFGPSLGAALIYGPMVMAVVDGGAAAL